MMIKVNGKERVFVEGVTLLSIIEQEALLPGRTVVEYNKEIIPDDRLRDIVVAEKDSVEILSFVGGG